MNVVAINGSARPDGNTSILINKVFTELESEGIETKEIHVGSDKINGCIACMKCWENQDGHCAIDTDSLNEYLDQMYKADGIILGSPVYCADLSGQMKVFIDRVAMVACANNDMFKRKVGASVVALRRAGAVTTFHSINSFFSIAQMVIVGSSYWNLAFGMDKGEVKQDDEGMQTMRNLGKNMVWLMKSIEAAKGVVVEPETSRETMTNFIR